MLIKWGALIVDGSGKLGGHVATRNRAGAVMRTKVVPINPDSPDQQTVRNLFAANTQGWKGITADQRASWQAAVDDFKYTNRLGDIRRYSGFNLYCRINNYLRFINGTPLTSPPAPAAVPAFTSLSVAADFGAQSVTLTYAGTIGATETCIVRATTGMSAGKSFVKSEYRKIDFMLAADVTPFVISTEYIAKFGAVPAEGTRISVTMQNIVTLTGLPGARISASCLVTNV